MNKNSEIAVDCCLMYMRNAVPGVICPSSLTCEPDKFCPEPTSVLSIPYCKRAKLAEYLEATLRTAIAKADIQMCRNALNIMKEDLVPMIQEDRYHNACRDLNALVIATLKGLSDDTRRSN